MLFSFPPPLILSLAIVLEVVATSLLPKTQQFTSLPATAAVLAGYGCAFYLLSLTVQTMSLGVAYAIWCGAGIGVSRSTVLAGLRAKARHLRSHRYRFDSGWRGDY